VPSLTDIADTNIIIISCAIKDLHRLACSSAAV